MNKLCIESTGRATALRRIVRAPRRLPLSLALAAALAAGFLAPSGAGAATYTWAGNKSNATWGTAGNWTTPCITGATCYNQDGGPPQGSILIFNNSLRPTIYGVPTGHSFESIIFGVSAGATSFEMDRGGVVINLSKGILNLSGKKQIFNFRIDAQGDQTWAGGSGGVQLYNTGDLNHSLTLADVTMGNVGNVNTTVGSTGAGILSLGVKSTLAAPEIMLGKVYDSSGTIHLTHDAARLSAVGNLIVGFSGAGDLNIRSGEAISNQAFVGMNYGSQGTVLIDGTASKLTVSSVLEVGRASTGTVTVQNGGTLITNGESFIGKALGGDGLALVTGASSIWTTTGPLTVGELGVGRLQVAAGGKLNSVGATLGNQSGSLGEAKVAGANASWVATGTLQIGNLGEGILSVEQGGLLSTSNATLGTVTDAGQSTAQVTGSGSRWQSAGKLRVDSGTLTVASGGVISGDEAIFGETSSAVARVDLSGAGSALALSNRLTIGSTTGAGTTGTVTIGSGATLSVGTDLHIWKSGVLILDGGTLNTGRATVNEGQVIWNSGTVNFAGTLISGDSLLAHSTGLGVGMNIQVDGMLIIKAGDDLSLNGGQAQAWALSVAGDVAISSFSQLSVGSLGGGISGSVQLAGGTISSVGRLDNPGLVSGYGVITGTGGFVNSGLLRQGDGNLVLSNTGVNLNTGTWEMQAGRSLTLSSSLENRAALHLGGGSLIGSGSLVNGTQGMVSGSGRIATGFNNQGALVVDAGLTQIDQSFVNRGQILLGGNSATLSGGHIDNQGLIQGVGRINNNIANTGAAGVIEAQGGTLTLAGQIVGANGGILAAGSGAKLLISQGLARNAGQIQLAGGTFDNNGQALVNEAAGSLSGHGNVRSGAFTNQGRVLLSGGTSAVYADVLGSHASQIILSGNSNTTFYGKVDIQSGAELRVSTGSVATFFELVQQRSGAKFTGSGAKRFEGGLSVGASPGLGTDEGDVEFGESNTYLAEIGGPAACTLACGSNDAVKNGSFDKYAVLGQLSFGGTLTLTSWNGFVAQAGQHFDLFDWGSTTGSFASIDASGFKLAAGTQLDTSALYTTGEISVTAVPEPAHWAMLLAGLAGLAWRMRRQGTGQVSA